MVIRTRNELIEFIEDNAPTKAILRAVLNYNENLGGFIRSGVSNSKGWIVTVLSKFGRQWLLAIHPLKSGISGYKIWILFGEVPWKYWEGDKSENPLYQGDYPEIYKELRNEKKI